MRKRTRDALTAEELLDVLAADGITLTLAEPVDFYGFAGATYDDSFAVTS